MADTKAYDDRFAVMRSVSEANIRNRGSVKKAGTIGATTGGLGVSFATCHSMCQVLISVFAIMGITLLGMPLAFLEPYSIPLLILAAISLGASVWMCKRHNLPFSTLIKPLATGFIIALVIIIFIFTMSASFMIGQGSVSNNQVSGGAQPDKCAVQPGYTEESWREHMGHHPDLYAECLGR